uniref:Gypsy retrotransposon integrase-like protein 1 n=1 Tax=Knipowitschia caucasica TaxID=637954 RepID=A0AAV2LLM9_KNICA
MTSSPGPVLQSSNLLAGWPCKSSRMQTGRSVTPSRPASLHAAIAAGHHPSLWCYLLGRPFRVRTDHSGLRWLTRMKEPEVLPRKLQPDVLRQMHEGPVGGHFGVECTVARLQSRFYWYHMREDVALWCRTCTDCACRVKKTPRAAMGTVRVGAPMERIALDIMGPLNETDRKNRYILVIQEYFTKWTEAFPIPDEKAVTMAEVVATEWVCRYGMPHSLHSDQGRNFESEVFQEMCLLFGIEKTHTTSFRPQSDGQPPAVYEDAADGGAADGDAADGGAADGGAADGDAADGDTAAWGAVDHFCLHPMQLGPFHPLLPMSPVTMVGGGAKGGSHPPRPVELHSRRQRQAPDRYGDWLTK